MVTGKDMAEAEDLIIDTARHATVFTRRLWRRLRPPAPRPTGPALVDIAPRLDMLLTAIFAYRHPLRVAQPPARPGLLLRLSGRDTPPYTRQAVPATDGAQIWLPREAPMIDFQQGLAWYRAIALQQAMRVHRGSATLANTLPPLQRDIYLVLEARASEAALIRKLPGLQSDLRQLRHQALAARPPLHSFRGPRRELERWLRQMMSTEEDATATPDAPMHAVTLAHTIATQLLSSYATERAFGLQPLVKDSWTGQWLSPVAPSSQAESSATDAPAAPAPPPRSARLARRPTVRPPQPKEDEDRQSPGPWMVQPEHPHEHAEDPLGLQRPVDRDEHSTADEFGELVSELREARLVTTPGRPREVLLTDDPPDVRTPLPTQRRSPSGPATERFHYPEWDYRIAAYRDLATTVHRQAASAGPQEWVDQTLIRHRRLLHAIRRHFDMLRAEPVRLRKQLDGEDIDLDACLESHADVHAGRPRSEALYQTRRPARRSLAISLLIDVSGSTDSWVAGQQRIIDIEREALLLVSIALDELQENHAIQAFSGEGPHGVIIRDLKRFDEPYSNEVARRIAALEPEHYTRAGAAIRHATAGLMQQAASHRLLLLLSDGKPNDQDDYEGRYGLEDMRRAVIEARLQGVFPFCLTVDRQAPAYLPRVFGAFHYALLQQPERLPTVLLEWMKRLLQH